MELFLALSAAAAEYTYSISELGKNSLISVLDTTLNNLMVKLQ